MGKKLMNEICDRCRRTIGSLGYYYTPTYHALGKKRILGFCSIACLLYNQRHKLRITKKNLKDWFPLT